MQVALYLLIGFVVAVLAYAFDAVDCGEVYSIEIAFVFFGWPMAVFVFIIYGIGMLVKLCGDVLCDAFYRIRRRK